MSPISDVATKARADLDTWFRMWRASQGGDEHDRAIAVLLDALPFERTDEVRVMDLMSGPGDVGWMTRQRFPNSSVVYVDRDPFLLALGVERCRRAGLAFEHYQRNCWDADWHADFIRGSFDAIIVTTALHWLDESRLAELFIEVRGLLRAKGLFVFMEPVRTSVGETVVHAGAPSSGPASGGDWASFLARVDEELGEEHRRSVWQVPEGRTPIGDRGLPISIYKDLVERSGFASLTVIDERNGTLTAAASAETSKLRGGQERSI